MKVSVSTCVAALLVSLCAAANSAEVPSTTRAWHGEDFQALASAIAKHSIALPRFTSPEGSRLIARATSSENILVVQTSQASLLDRYRDVTLMREGVANLIDEYLAELRRDRSVAPEAFAIQAYSVRVAGVDAAILTELSAGAIQHKRDDILAEAKKMAAGLPALIDLSERSLSAPMPPAELAAMMDALASAIPDVSPWMSDDMRVDLKRRFSQRRSTSRDTSTSSTLDRIVAELK